MTALIISIICMTLIFVIFKLFSKFEINTFQAIVFNYFTAFSIGMLLYGHEWPTDALTKLSWLPFAILCSVLFIGLFFIMGKSSQLNGIASTSVAVKMSMAISLICMVIGYSEQISFLKSAGIVFAFIGVYLVSSSPSSNREKSPYAWMLIVLFFGSGLLDFTLNYTQKFALGNMSASIFSALSLGLSGAIGLALLITRLVQKRERLQTKNVIAGIILGVPNFFSIYTLLRAYQTTGWDDSTVLAITNVSVVGISAVIGFSFFIEKAGWRKLLGLLSALIAILTLYYANLVQ